MVIVGNDRLQVESELLAGGFVCPDCSGVLRPWGSARRRVLRCAAGEVWRRPRRGRCGDCGGTHVLLSADSLVRRRDETAVIGAALVMNAAGHGHRRAADTLGLPSSTVRGWLRRFARNAEAIRVWFTVLAHGLDPVLGVISPTGSGVGDAVEAIAIAARSASLRLGLSSPWWFVSKASKGRLLSNTGCPWAPAV